MKIRNIVMYVAVGVIFVAALVLVIFGVVTHTEAGLLTACDGPGGRLDYSGECYDVTWDKDQFPLQVSASTTNPYPPEDPEDATQSVIRLINGRLGFTALEWRGEELSADITVDIATAQEVDNWMGDSNGSASHMRMPDGTLRCEVATWNTGTLEVLDKVLTHEMYHALGLAHDDFEDSAMFPTVSPDGNRLTRLRATDTDRSTLRDLYAP